MSGIAGICEMVGRHTMSTWGEPETINGMLVQRRSCDLCNSVEFRTVMITRPKA